MRDLGNQAAIWSEGEKRLLVRTEKRRSAGEALVGALTGLSARRLAGLRRADGSLVRNSSVLFLATLVGQLLGFGIQIVLARRLGIESYGLYAYAITWVSFLALLATMGGDRLLVRFLGEYRARQILRERPVTAPYDTCSRLGTFGSRTEY